jgi:NAD+ synthase
MYIMRCHYYLALQKICDFIKEFLINQVRERKAKGVVIGISGGLDSSVVAALAVKALKSSSVLGLLLPEQGITPREDFDDALDLAKKLAISYRIIEISKKKQEIMKDLPSDPLAQGNLAARIRMCILYFFASYKGMLVAGTTDKSELKLGYYTKYGDGSADILPIADLYKTQVRELAYYLDIPERIIKKDSRPGLWEEHTAEGEIGLPYTVVDNILRESENKNVNSNLYDAEAVRRVQVLIEKNKHKGEMPVVCKLSNLY